MTCGLPRYRVLVRPMPDKTTGPTQASRVWRRASKPLDTLAEADELMNTLIASELDQPARLWHEYAITEVHSRKENR